MKKILLVLLILALSAVTVLRIVRFTVINESDYDIQIRMDFYELDDQEDAQEVNYPGMYYMVVPNDKKKHTFTVVKVPYLMDWWTLNAKTEYSGVYLKPTIGLGYDEKNDSILFEPFVSSVLRFQQREKSPQWYYDWIIRWDLEDNYITK